METKTKIQSLETLPGMIDRFKRDGKRIVFTNGCFDLLHVGHVRYLQQAKALGDVLVVGLNSDASVRQIKGEKRPLIAQEERAEILSALECVDLVVLFEDPTPYRLIAIVRPHVLVKGGDWPTEKIVGKDIVEQEGGKVFTIPLVQGASTSGLIGRIVERYKG
jgi:D-beta-D-heptose 7-phosphate kinase/D-beta-D-heptose 1-phosphate adenosyltransferase